MHWAKFANALKDIEDRPYPGAENVRKMALIALPVAQRFYIPDGSSVIDGKFMDAEMLKLMHLPYDTVAILHESFIGKKTNPAWLITLAIDANSPFCRQHKLCGGDFCDILILSILHWKQQPFWVLTPFVAALTFTPPAGYSTGLCDTRNSIDFAAHFPLEDFTPDVGAVMNLCALLGTTVAKTETVHPPAKLNAARVRRGKTPLPSYHVLNVGGEIWDSPHVSGGSGHGVRSHLRRGHIRHLDDERWVWVRSTIVVGSREGFVNKEYKVTQ